MAKPERTAIDAIEEHAKKDGITSKEYLRRQANLGILASDDGAFVLGEEFFVVEVTQDNHVKVIGSSPTQDDGRNSIMAVMHGRLKAGRRNSSGFLIMCADVDLPADNVQSSQVVVESRDLETNVHRRSLVNKGVVWVRNASRH